MIADTTPLRQLLDARYPERAMFPAGEMGAFVHLLEEYFDELIARTTVHWRWNYQENHELLSLDAAHGIAVGNQQALAKGDKAFVIPMYGEGVSYLARPYIEKSRRMLAAHIATARVRAVNCQGCSQQHGHCWRVPAMTAYASVWPQLARMKEVGLG